MRKLIIILILMPFLTKGQSAIDGTGTTLLAYFPKEKQSYLTVDTSHYRTKVSDTLFVTDEHIKFISIGGRVYEILPPTLREVEINRISNFGTLVLPYTTTVPLTTPNYSK